MSLTKKQMAFVEAYLIDPNGKKAAIAAGYAPAAAEVQASRLLRHAKVRAELSARQKVLGIKSGVTPERVMSELAKIGFSDIRQVIEWQTAIEQRGEDVDTGMPILETGVVVTIKSSGDIDDETAAAISEVKQTKDGALQVRMHDKLGALVKMGQHLGMFRPASAPADVPGKKERARLAAETAGIDSEWGDDLAPGATRLN